MDMDNFGERQKIIDAIVNEKKVFIRDKERLEIDNIFTSLMKENKNKNKTNLEQESLFGAITEKVLAGDRSSSIFSYHGDNRHMVYYDVFLNGEALKVTNALNEHGLSTEVLKHKSINPNHDLNIPEGDDGIGITQTVEDSDESPKVILEFVITYNGKEIYRYDGEDSFEITQEIPENWIKTKKGTDRVNPVVSKEITEQGEITTEFGHDRYGNSVTRRRINGRFAKWAK